MATFVGCSRVVLGAWPFADAPDNASGRWPGGWVSVKTPDEPYVAAYRLLVTLPAAQKVRVHVTADNRYELYANGRLIARGSERGDRDNWFFETYDLEIPAGTHVLVAKVWSFGERAPIAQMSLRHGFWLQTDKHEDSALLSTGTAKWEGKVLPGITVTEAGTAWGAGGKVDIDGSKFDWNLMLGIGEGWSEARKVEESVKAGNTNDLNPSHLLRPGLLPAMISQPWVASVVRHAAPHTGETTSKTPILAKDSVPGLAEKWQGLLGGHPIEIPAHSTWRILFDHTDYLTAYHHLVTSGGAGAKVRMNWQEALFIKPDAPAKGNRDEIEGKYFTSIWEWRDGVGDIFRPDGGQKRRFASIWWHSGRYVEILVHTEAEPLTIHELGFEETRYPKENESRFKSSDPRLASVIPIAHRTLQMCSHESFMDCPYYEQLQYVGDTRIQALVTYVSSSDDRLVRKAIEILDISRLNDGLTQSRYPSRVRQIIPTFSLWWIAMVHDFALWRGDMEFVRKRMLGVRAVMEYYRSLVTPDFLINAPDGWNFVDWVPGWQSGMPPGMSKEHSSILQFHMAWVLKMKAELEMWVGDEVLARRDEALAAELLKHAPRYYDHDHHAYADDLKLSSWSEHAQCLALLAESAPFEKVIAHTLTSPDKIQLNHTTIYFAHYLFETYYKLRRTDLTLDRMALWFDHPKMGMKTTLEEPEPTRSDCHAWGAHPMYHYFASFLGVRPTAPGMKEVTIHPCLGPLTHAEGEMPTPLGRLWVRVEGRKLSFTAPAGMVVRVGGHTYTGGPVDVDLG